ncbi:MAG: RusA family crossover junction endodeoxyribonuclease, partial [Bradyrhizobium sp.]|nr:RusA family crossover junction endodeoxyribonuclease [Bradyrhizobium sp.]
VIGAGGRPVILHHTPEKTVVYENLVRLAAEQAMYGRAPFEGALILTVEAFFTIPASWSARKRLTAVGCPVIKRPDLDNCIKAVKDGCNGVAWKDDSQCTSLHASKRYDTAPRIEVTIQEVSDVA